MTTVSVKHALDDLVTQIVTIARPVRVVLFGSSVRGDRRPWSDLDLLVVVPDGVPCRQLARRLYQEIHGIIIPYDLVVVNVSLLEQHSKTLGLIYHYALAEGEELYAA